MDVTIIPKQISGILFELDQLLPSRALQLWLGREILPRSCVEIDTTHACNARARETPPGFGELTHFIWVWGPVSNAQLGKWVLKNVDTGVLALFCVIFV